MKTMMKQRLFESKNDMPEATRAKVTEVLNQSLATAFDLKSQIKQAHWNVKGIQFYSLHQLFDLLSGEIEGYVDMLAERITTLGGVAFGTARMAAQNSVLPEYPTDITNGMEHLQCMIERYAIYGKLLRENIDKTDEWGDADTADLFTEVSRNADLRLWFLEAHTQG